ncbi:MAG: FkbM family methyltransferase [Coleofasciculus chthonoplastes F3-SA18-01]|uniref:FkbM family methyltransferase n=1 Tax=Coleofasciculus chthonoplastes TaxID=64178 RepID=UPI0032F5C07D
MMIETIEDHTIHTRFLSSNSRVLDLGANRGSFSQAMITRFGCQCVAVEPNPKLFEKIEPHELLKKYNLAIAHFSGSVNFNVSEVSVSSSIVYRSKLHSKTITVSCKPLEEFVVELGWTGVDLIKMDIEGAEINVFHECSDSFLKSIGQITVEFHDHNGTVSKYEVKELIKRFESLGFRCYSKYLGCYYDTLFINQSLCPISIGEYLWIRHIIRNQQGLQRRFQKLLAAASS